MRNKKWVLNALFLPGIFLAFSCNSDITSPKTNPSSEDYSQLSGLLEQAYKRQSQAALNNFFVAWREKLPAYTAEEMAAFPDTIRQVYNLFQEFYSPTDLNRITGGYHENFETDFRYIVIQNDVQFAIVDTLPGYYFYQGVEIVEKQIQDFRPVQSDLPLPAVYLSAQADSVIYSFLFQLDGEYREDYQSRESFLRQAMQLTHHHWIADYHKATMPVVSHIYFDASLTQALMHFRVFYQFGEAYLEQKNGEWTLISSKLTAIK